ncbi:MAG: shikimate dehydrogenase [Patescibacteria group bacterium]
MISEFTKLNGVIGYPLRHSMGPRYYGILYERLSLDAVYLAFPTQDVKAIVGAIRALPLHLVAVTIPHKETVMQYLDSIDPVAIAVGAVNTIVNRDGILTGYNTDVVGVNRAIEDVILKDRRVLILGAGGAARAVAYSVRSRGAHITIAARTGTRAVVLASDFSGSVIPFSPLSVVNHETPLRRPGGSDTLQLRSQRSDPPGHLRGFRDSQLSDTDFDVIINTTPIGMSPNIHATPLEGYPFHSGQTVFDVVYNPLETRLLADAHSRGARTISGFDMYLHQGLEQVRLWSGVAPPEDEARNILKSLLNPRPQPLTSNLKPLTLSP